MAQRVAERVRLDAGMTVSYSGQFEFLERANARLTWVVPATLLIIFVLLYLTFGRIDEALMIMATLPFALTGGIMALWLRDIPLSISAGVGFTCVCVDRTASSHPTRTAGSLPVMSRSATSRRPSAPTLNSSHRTPSVRTPE